MKFCKTSIEQRESQKQRRWQKYHLTTRQRDQLWYERKTCKQCKKNKLLGKFTVPYKVEKFYDICKECRK